jgi:hypothetical protein
MTTMQTDDALAFLCRGLCVEVGPSLSAALKPTLIEEGPLPPCCPATWLAKGCRLVTLIQTERGTRVYDQKEDFLYYASEAAQLGRNCPPGHAFLGQTVYDRDGASGRLVPRVLIMDLVCPRIDDPCERGTRVRKLSPCFPPACHVQWAGERASLERFLKSGSVPHEVECVVALREPGKLVRECDPRRGATPLLYGLTFC